MKILTLEDLYAFCSTQNLTHFNAKEDGGQIVVSVPSSFNYVKEYESDSMLVCPIKAFHVGRNRNGSSVTMEAAEKAIKTMAYKPVLANFIGEGDEEDFSSHDMSYDEEKDELIYLERQVGCFTADMPYIEHDEENDKDYVYAEVAISREYTHAADIIERKGGTGCSVELAVNEMSYSAKDKLLELTDVEVLAVTLLGDHVEPGMVGAHVSTEEFDSKDTEEKQVEGTVLSSKEDSSFNITSFEEGGNGALDKEQLEELTIETEEAEVIASEEDVVKEEESIELSEEDDEEEIVDEEEPEDEDDDEEDPKEEEAEETNFAVRTGDKVYAFDISYEEIKYALLTLVNDMYSEADNEWYSIIMYDGYVVMIGYWHSAMYKQEYEEVDGSYSLKGDRVQVYCQYLTKEEIDALEDLRSNYASVVSELNSYKEKELHSERELVFADDSYKDYLETQEFSELRSNMDNYSVEELRQKADLAFAKCVKRDSKKKDASKRTFAIGQPVDEKAEMYPGLF